MATACISASSIVPALRARVQPRRTAARSTKVRAGMDMKQGSGFETIEVTLDRPMGLQLNSGREGIGAYVAGIVPDGNAAKAGTVRVGDVMVSCADGVDTRGVDFDDIMDALAANPDAPTMKLAFKRWPDTPNKTSPEGYVWLEANATREDVVVLPSGLQYRVLEEGTGPTGRITKDTPCSCHYEGKLIDGTVFDSSIKRGKPITFAPKQVIRGWTEAMGMMREGDRWELFIPAELGYGGRGSPSGSIKPGDALIFEMKIERVNP